jgi:uncharacterized protein YegL
MRRLPVYLLLDCSESMIGEPLKAVEDGVRQLLNSLKKNPYALETVWLSVITFDVKARITTPLTEFSAFKPPKLSVKPGTALGAALDLLQKTMQKDLVKSTKDTKGDYKSLVFIFTDGYPTDNWKQLSKNLLKSKSSLADIYIIGCGDEVNFEVMGQISDKCIHLKNLTSEGMNNAFVWLSTSIATSSAKIEEGPVDLRKVPLGRDLELVDLTKPPQFIDNAWFFLHAICTKTGKYYLMRYRREPKSNLYYSKDSLPLPEDFFSEGTLTSPSVDSTNIKDVPPCPFCGNDALFNCNVCHTLNCLSISGNSNVQCAKCGHKAKVGFGTGFSVRGSGG